MSTRPQMRLRVRPEGPDEGPATSLLGQVAPLITG